MGKHDIIMQGSQKPVTSDADYLEGGRQEELDFPTIWFGGCYGNMRTLPALILPMQDLSQSLLCLRALDSPFFCSSIAVTGTTVCCHTLGKKAFLRRDKVIPVGFLHLVYGLGIWLE